MRHDATRIAFAASKAVLAAARPLQLDIAGTATTCTLRHLDAPDWPGPEETTLDESRDGPWPANSTEARNP